MQIVEFGYNLANVTKNNQSSSSSSMWMAPLMKIIWPLETGFAIIKSFREIIAYYCDPHPTLHFRILSEFKNILNTVATLTNLLTNFRNST